MKTLNDIINWIINSGFLALLIYIAVAFGKPCVESQAWRNGTNENTKRHH